jgi:nitrite reductase/ring-hydroxylating ferredoxin subunit
VSEVPVIDLARVICGIGEIPNPGSRSFTLGPGPWPLRGFVVRKGEELRAYVNHCPHAGHPLNLMPDRFLTRDETLILCSSHGALFEIGTGLCVAGPCTGARLRPLPVRVESGYVILGDEVALEEPMDQ